MQNLKYSMYLFYIIFCFYFYSAFAQPLQIEKLTIAEGLSNARVHHIMQDSYGLLWICTNDGLNLYDGYKFKIFKNVPGNPKSLLHNITWGSIEDNEKNIWISTEVGVSRYIRTQNEFVNYDFSEIFPLQTTEQLRAFSIEFDHQNNVWISTVGLGILKYSVDNDSWEMQKFFSSDSSDGIELQSPVAALIMDQNNKIWAGSFRFGLVWYDSTIHGFREAEFSKDSPDIDFTQTENHITWIYADPTGVLWITTRNGILKYDPSTKYLRALAEYKTHKFSFWNYFNSITADMDGNVWIANNQRGVLKFDGISDESERIVFSEQNFNREGLSNIVFTRIMTDKTGIMWFGTVNDGVIKYDPRRAPFVHYKYDEKNKTGISGNQVFSLYESKKKTGKIYIGTRGSGLNLFDPESKIFERIPFRVLYDDFGGSVRSIFEDKDGSLWLGTWGNGLIKMDKNYNEIRRFVNDSSNANSLSGDLIRVIKKGPDGNLWIGTTAGLNHLDFNTYKVSRITDRFSAVYQQELIEVVRQNIENDKADVSIRNVDNFKDLSRQFEVIKPRNYLVISTGEGFENDSSMVDYGWITDNSGKSVWRSRDPSETCHAGGALKNRIKIDLVHFKPGKYELHYKSDDSHSYDNWNANPPSYLNLWGIHIIEITDENESNKIKQYLANLKNRLFIKGSNIRSIHVSKNNIIWIGSDQFGLNRYDWNKKSVKTYSYNPDDPNSISNNSVQYIHEDKDGILWLATNNGLNRFDPVKETFSVYTEEDGLPTNYIASILPGDTGELWLATRNGISKMVTVKSTGKVTFVNYDISDGLGGTDFIALVALKSGNRYYFGGEHGLNAFTPGKVNKTPPSLIISDMQISNRSVLTMKNDSPSEKSLYDLKELELPYDKNDLAFEFAALHYSNPVKNQYAHMLKGYDKDWIYNNSRTATYTNLDPGDYVFTFKGTNRDGVWNEDGKSIKITIHPPWWQTIWAYIGYGLLFIATIVAVDRFQRRRLLAKTKERLRLQEAELRAEAAELKVKATEAEHRALEAENARKSRELEEARELQLSMLPRQLPQLPHLDIAVYMKTATEVGGDYYDFHVGMDGTLTVVIGDATGHGMKAGTMVTTAKSLFNSYAPNTDILFSFHEITRCIKQMNLGKMSMCMTMLKLQGNKLKMTAAGMPPTFIFRRDTRVVEEHLMQGVPLGTMDKFPYKILDTTLKPGDTILLLSDGLPELQNDKNEIYGYKRVRNIFEEIADKDPEDIISYLKNDGSEWIEDEDPDDDVTFVVLKVR